MKFTAFVMIILFVLVAVLKWITSVSLDQPEQILLALNQEASVAPLGSCVIIEAPLAKDGQKPGIIRKSTTGEIVVRIPANGIEVTTPLNTVSVLGLYPVAESGEARNRWDDCLEQFALFGVQ